MSCFVVSNETIDAIVMAIIGGTRSSLLLLKNLGEYRMPRSDINPEYEEIWPELTDMVSLEQLGDRLLVHNLEAYKYSNTVDAHKHTYNRKYRCNLLGKANYKDIEMLMAMECYMYQIVDHEEETRHPIFRLMKEACSQHYREYVRALPEWDQCANLWR